MKECSRCKLQKELSMFDKSRSKYSRDRLQAWCRECKVLMQRQYHKKYYRNNRTTKLAAQREYTRFIRKTLVEGYGGKCECCGDTNIEFLAIDHINGGGKADRKLHGDARGFYRFLIKAGFPKDKYRLLCHNCNQSRGSFGYCPHGCLCRGD